MNRPTFSALLLAIPLGIAVCNALGFIDAASDCLGDEPTRTDRYGDPLPEGAVMRLGTVRFCQPNPRCIAFSPDGKILASGGGDIRFWDPDTGKELLTLESHSDNANCIAFSSNGKVLVSGSQAGGLCLWDTKSGKLIRRFEDQGPVERLALSPNGKMLVSTCQGGSLAAWDTQSGDQVRSLPPDAAGVRLNPNPIALAFAPDGKHLALSHRTDDAIDLIQVDEWKVIQTFKPNLAKTAVCALTFSPDGKTLYSSDRALRRWNVATGKEDVSWRREKVEAAWSLALAPDEKSLAVGSTNFRGKDLRQNKLSVWQCYFRGWIS